MPCGTNSTCGLFLSEYLTTSKTTGNSTNGTEISRSLTSAELTAILTLAVLTLICNVVVLLASKFTSGGQSPTLVFIRCLSVADALIGAYGISKVIMFFFLDGLLMNFFLPESLFFTASFASSLSLLFLNVDCCMKLTYPLYYSEYMDKRNIITIMVILWNMSFIVGFLPQMGWREKDYVHNFFMYYPWHYLFFVGLVMTLIFFADIVFILYVRKKIYLVQSHQSFLSPQTAKFKTYHGLLITSTIDMCGSLLCYLPYFVYLGLYCDICIFSGSWNASINIQYFVPVFLVKSFTSAIVHGYRTAQIHAVMQKLSRRLSRMIQNSNRKRYIYRTNGNTFQTSSDKYSNTPSDTSNCDNQVLSGSQMTITSGVHDDNQVTRL